MHRSSKPPLAKLLLFGLLATFVAGGQESGPRELPPDRVSAARLEPGAVDRWRLNLDRDEFVEIDIAQRSQDLALLVRRPEGETHLKVDATAPPDSESLEFVTPTAGGWDLEVRGVNEQTGGPYTIHWKTHRPATPEDRQRSASFVSWLEALEALAAGEPDAAGRLLERSVSLLEEGGGDPLKLQERLDWLAYVQLQKGDFPSAEQAARRSLDILENLASDHPRRMAAALQKLAQAEQSQGRFAEAAQSFQESLRSLERAYGEDHVELVQTLGGLGQLRYYLAQYPEALEAMGRAARILEQRENPEDPTLATVLNNLALIKETVGDFAGATQSYERALDIRQRLLGPDHEELAVTLSNLALLLEVQGRYEEAESALRRAVAILESSLGGDHPDLGKAVNNLAAVLKTQGKYDEAETLYQRVEAIFRQAHGEKHQDTAGVLGNIASLYMVQGRYSEAEALSSSALEILSEVLGDHPDTANAISNLGQVCAERGRYRQAEELFQRAISMLEGIFGQDGLQVLAPLNNLGGLYVDIGRVAEAETVFSRQARIIESALGPTHPDLALSLNNLGSVYLEQGRLESAERSFLAAKKIWETLHETDHVNLAVAHHNLARISMEAGDTEEAEALLAEALRIRRAVTGADDPGLVASLAQVGDLQLDRGDASAALAAYREAMAVAGKSLDSSHPQVGVLHGRLGRSLARLGRIEEARGELEMGIRILEESSAFPESQIQNYSALARLEKQAGNPARAMVLLSEALEKAEHLRPRVGGGEETRAEFLERIGEEFALMVQWQMESGHPERAFEYAERGRARALLDQLSLSGIDLRESLPAEVREELENREARARAELAEYQQRMRSVQARKDLDASERSRRASEFKARLRAAEREFQQVYEEMKSSSPLWTSLITSRGELVSLPELQEQLVPQGSAMLFYQIGEEASYLFLIPSPGEPAAVFELELGEDAAKAGTEPGPLTASKLASLFQLGVSDDAGAAVARLGQFPLLAQLVMRSLVPDPAWGRIRQLEEVIIVPHGALHFFPFDMGVVQLDEDGDEPVYWLDVGPAVRYVSSATTLRNLEMPHPEAAGGVLSLSDPVFDPSEAEPAQQPVSAEEAAEAPTRRLGEWELERLPGTARESARIAEVFEEFALLQRDAATEFNLRRALPGRTYLHLATHGLVSQQRRSLFSALALTAPPDMEQGSLNDGFLQLYEVYDLDLTGTQLAVLSACRTNVGSKVSNDGVFALSRGFLAAGVPRVVASQWSVDDESTAELIGSFFDQIAAARRAGEPLDYARFLREAKRRVRRQEGWRSPYHWAPFVLIGAR